MITAIHLREKIVLENTNFVVKERGGGIHAYSRSSRYAFVLLLLISNEDIFISTLLSSYELVLSNDWISINVLLPSGKNLHRPDTSLIVQKNKGKREQEKEKKVCNCKKKVRIELAQ